ncbi:hypothetical protein COY90_03140, partial [Candidatus Roizmanbacteria bacterium CG_4_10_14_0_8_um_filter_39_9]
MIIKTSEFEAIEPFLQRFIKPDLLSHKGQNGKITIIGGSSLFHSAPIWSAQVASHLVDMVHFSSTPENNKTLLDIKKKWQGGIVVPLKDIGNYIAEDDAVLIGTGMMREGNEGVHTKELTHSLLMQYPHKKWVIDAGALQMIDTKQLCLLKEKPILTPHQKEFKILFGDNILHVSQSEKIKVVEERARTYRCIILCKAVCDIVSDGAQTVVIEGGNAGLTKGGTGDVLAALCASFAATQDSFLSAVLASFLL